MNITRKKNSIIKFRSKKGISLVLAIALSIVLCMATATFISIAMLQQKDTGSELNSRQAYVSAKGAVETVENMIMEDKITLPTSGKKYIVVFYSGGVLTYAPFGSAEDAKNWIKNNKDTYNIIGNNYTVISTDGNGNYRLITAGTEDKYAGSNGSSRERTLSKSFAVKAELAWNTSGEPGITSETSYPSSGGSGPFLAVGMQTNYSLLYSYLGINNSTWSLGQRESIDANGSTPVMEINVEARDTNANGGVLVNSQLPIVYNRCVKCNTNSNRNMFTAKNEGVYFLGNNTAKDMSDYGSNGIQNAAFYTSNAIFAPKYCCSYVVINHNMYTRRSGSSLDYGINVEYSGSNSKNKVLVYIPNSSGVQFNVYDNDSKSKRTGESFTLASGYYEVTSGTNLFNHSNYKKITGTNEELSKYNMSTAEVSRVLKLNPHSATEQVEVGGKNKVEILYANGEFAKNSKVYGNITNTSYCKDWAPYDIYCAPNFTPAANGEFHWYSGSSDQTTGSFNLLWYNVNAFGLKENVNLNIHSKEINLAIGPDTGEKVGKYTKPDGSGSYKTVIGSSTANFSDIRTNGSNLVSGKEGAKFWLRPFWGEKNCTINVNNDFNVRYVDSSGATKNYTIAKGSYKIDLDDTKADGTKLYPSGGINLFSEEAEKQFKSPKVSKVSTWVDASGKIKNEAPADLSADANYKGKVVQFNASSGDLYSGATYKADGIDINFSHTVNTNAATIKTRCLSIDAPKLVGNALYIDTTDGCNASSGIRYTAQKVMTLADGTKQVTKLDNYVRVEFPRTTTLVMKNQNIAGTTKDEEIDVKGVYLFPLNGASKVNIMDWNRWKGAYTLEPGTPEKFDPKPVTKKERYGGYY